MKMVWLLPRRNEDNLKSLHKTIKKVAEDIEGFSFNTSVSVYDLCEWIVYSKLSSRAILEPLAIVISPYAPHIAENYGLCLVMKVRAAVPFPVLIQNIW
jgi:leucyl-tRNA synthetase